MQQPAASPDVPRYRIETAAQRPWAISLAGLALVIVLAALPAFAGRGVLQNLIFVFYMLALAQCWNLLAGYAGLVSIGQQALALPDPLNRVFMIRKERPDSEPDPLNVAVRPCSCDVNDAIGG